MHEFHNITVNVPITCDGQTLTCTTCGQSLGLTLSGVLGDVPSVTCRSGHTFAPPRPFNIPETLRHFVDHPGRELVSRYRVRG